MNSFVLPLLMGMGAQQGEGGGNPLIGLLPFILIIGIFYFLIIRPQNKKRKETEGMLKSLKKGDKVMTIGGIYGTVQSVKDTTVIVKIDDNVKVEFSRSAVSNIVTPGKEETNIQSEEQTEENS
jgi:preprotein translocase subunit YajC